MIDKKKVDDHKKNVTGSVKPAAAAKAKVDANKKAEVKKKA